MAAEGFEPITIWGNREKVNSFVVQVLGAKPHKVNNYSGDGVILDEVVLLLLNVGF